MKLTALPKSQGEAARRYIALKRRQAKIAAELKEIEPEAMTAVRTAGGKIKSGTATLAIHERNNFTFSESLRKAKADLRELEKIEKEDGTAKLVTKPFLHITFA